MTFRADVHCGCVYIKERGTVIVALCVLRFIIYWKVACEFRARVRYITVGYLYRI